MPWPASASTTENEQLHNDTVTANEHAESAEKTPARISTIKNDERWQNITSIFHGLKKTPSKLDARMSSAHMQKTSTIKSGIASVVENFYEEFHTWTTNTNTRTATIKYNARWRRSRCRTSTTPSTESKEANLQTRDVSTQAWSNTLPEESKDNLLRVHQSRQTKRITATKLAGYDDPNHIQERRVTISIPTHLFHHHFLQALQPAHPQTSIYRPHWTPVSL